MARAADYAGAGEANAVETGRQTGRILEMDMGARTRPGGRNAGGAPAKNAFDGVA